MNVTTINQLVSVNILLDQDEALDALKDPRELQRKLREALGDVAPVTLGGRRNGHRKPGPKGKAATRKATSTHGAGRDSMTTCSACGKEYKSAGLGIHMARKHPSLAVPIAGD